MPGGLRLARRRRRELHVLLRHVRGRLRRPPRERRARTPCRRTARTPRTRPIEETELNYPVSIERLALVEDSEGPGRFRGGLGLRKDYRFDLHDDLHRARRPRPARAVGRGGRPQRPRRRVRPRPGRRRDAPRLEEHDRPRPGRRRSASAAAAAAATGRRSERDPERVLRDVLEGKVSVERARDEYLVAIDGRRRRRGRNDRAEEALPHERASGDRHRRDVHRCDPDRRGDGRGVDRQGADDAGRPLGGIHAGRRAAPSRRVASTRAT